MGALAEEGAGSIGDPKAGVDSVLLCVFLNRTPGAVAGIDGDPSGGTPPVSDNAAFTPIDPVDGLSAVPSKPLNPL